MSTQYAVFWCFIHALCMDCTRRGASKSNMWRSLWFFVHKIHKREEYRLSLLLEFFLPVSILNLWWSVNWLAHPIRWMYSRKCPEITHCPEVKDQWDCVLNDPEELGDKEFLVLTDQYNIYTVSWCFLHACCMDCIRRGASNSNVSVSLWFLSLGSTKRKNTVWCSKFNL